MGNVAEIPLRCGKTIPSSTERNSMFYVVLIVIAVVLAGALYLVRGRSA
jgi:hypothetical protein